ncbi:MAG TPA: DUF456 domain-containing protein [Mycobacteriales bacterium]|nr:DUF456 domain-containing protein [Mycobacteriales bacterium]
MTGGGQLAVGLAMVVGLIGVLVPVVPGVLLIWLAGLAWAIADGGGPARWTVFGLMSALFVLGTVAKYLLPARSAAARGAPATTLLAGALGAVVGFFVIPVIGLLIGGIAGIYLAELARLQDGRRALVSTKAALAGIGIGILIELAAGVLMIGTWLVGVLVT